MKNLVLLFIPLLFTINSLPAAKPNVVLVMADDQGWGQMGYMNHPALKTPHLDAMSENGAAFWSFLCRRARLFTDSRNGFDRTHA